MKKRKKSKADRVLDYMRENGGITTLDANRELGNTRLSASIWTLRHKRKIEINSVPKVVKDRFGDNSTVAYYTLKEE